MTPIRAQVLDVIRRYTAQGAPPSLDEISCEMGWKSRSNAHRVVAALRSEGVVTWDAHRAHSLRILADGPPRAAMERWSDEEVARVRLDLQDIATQRRVKGRAAA